MFVLAVAALTIAGLGIRIAVAHQSIFADELSTFWISATHSLGGVMSLMYGTGPIKHAEITPPLSFLASWLTSRIGHSPELIRLPELLAGTATIPLVYMLGERTIGRRGAIVATAFTAFAPFMIYYSAEARAYAIMMALIVGSTLALLQALDDRRARWWVTYAALSCAAFYAHYTSAFVLAVQAGWVLWAHPAARRSVVLANLGAAAAVLPWLPGLIADFRSPTLRILSALSVFTPRAVLTDLTHWAIGYPYEYQSPLTSLPGTPALALFGVAAVIVVVALARDRPRPALDRRVVLVVALALAAPVGEVLVSLAGNHVFGVRNIAASWPYMALSGAALLVSIRAPLRYAAAGLAIAAFALGGVKMLTARYQRPDYQSAAALIERQAKPGDVVLDETGVLSPGPLTGLDVALHTRVPVARGAAPAERDHPFGFLDPVVQPRAAVRRAVAAARGGRVFAVLSASNGSVHDPRFDPIRAYFPAGWHPVERVAYAGVVGTLVDVFAGPGSP
jgi:4-amino-4-deoxy-L-arabinose transferase-like glycosyltransferase